MFSPIMRFILVAGSILTIAFMMLRIRASKVQIKDSIFWIVFSLMMLLISLFPQLTEWASVRLGFLAPINFVYLLIIFVLLIKQFSSSVRISQLDTRQQQLAQRLALSEKAQEEAEAAAKTAGAAGPTGGAPNG